MNVQLALETLLAGQAIVVRDRTFTPVTIEKIRLDSGDYQYWIQGEDQIWLSFDKDSDEVILFEDIDEELEPVDEVVPYGGEDYELSVEQSGQVVDEQDEQLDRVEFSDYESSRGGILRLTEFEVSEDVVDVAIGSIVAEQELQAL